MRNHFVIYSVDELHALYVSLSATPEMVLAVIDEPDEADVCQAHVFGYLQQCIGNPSFPLFYYWKLSPYSESYICHVQ